MERQGGVWWWCTPPFAFHFHTRVLFVRFVSFVSFVSSSEGVVG